MTKHADEEREAEAYQEWLDGEQSVSDALHFTANPESEDHAVTEVGERPVIVIIDESRKLDQVPPCARGHHRWAWLTAGGQACGICGALRGEG